MQTFTHLYNTCKNYLLGNPLPNTQFKTTLYFNLKLVISQSQGNKKIEYPKENSEIETNVKNIRQLYRHKFYISLEYI